MHTNELGLAIDVRGLSISYGEIEAVKGIDLHVEAGEILAFLGPNGAGKTSTIEVLEGYLRPTSGQVSVLGIDPQKATRAWRERIGIVLLHGKIDRWLQPCGHADGDACLVVVALRECQEETGIAGLETLG